MRSKRVVRILAWSCALALSSAVIADRFANSEPIDTDFLALLPSEQLDPIETAAQERLAQATEGRVLFLVGADSDESAATESERLRQSILESDLFRPDPSFEPPPGAARFSSLYDFRFQLLSEPTRRTLASSPEALIEAAEARLFGPLALTALRQVASDPLGLFEDYVSQFAPEGVDVHSGSPVVVRDGRYWGIVAARIASSSFDLAALARLRATIRSLQSEHARRGTELLVTGIPVFAADGYERARHDISTIGFGSLAAIVLLLVTVFRSPIPIVLSIVALGTGLAVALASALLVFDRLHLLTLVFGSTLIGVSIDYALHYATSGLRSHGTSADDDARHILVPSLLGLSTTIVAYASMTIAPFPALQQIAVFSIAGLIGTWLTVVGVLPALDRGRRRCTPWTLRLPIALSARYPTLSTPAAAAVVAASTAAIAFFAVALPANDDVRNLQSPSDDVLRQAERIAGIVPLGHDTQFLLVRGNDVTDVLRREQAATRALSRMRDEGRLTDFSALSSVYPGVEAQHANHRLLRHAFYDSGRIDGLFDLVRLRPEIRQAHVQAFREASERAVQIDEFLAAVGEPWRTLWLGCASDCATIVSLSGYARLSKADRATLQALPGVKIADRAAAISRILAEYRRVATELLAGALLLIALLLAFRFGVAAAARMIVVPLCAITATLVLLATGQATLNILTMFALVLVAGLGIDYAIFYAVRGANDAATSLGVALSALTTLLSFGLMAFSSTGAVAEFGMVLAIGILAAYLSGPFAAPRNPDTGRDAL